MIVSVEMKYDINNNIMIIMTIYTQTQEVKDTSSTSPSTLPPPIDQHVTQHSDTSPVGMLTGQ